MNASNRTAESAAPRRRRSSARSKAADTPARSISAVEHGQWRAPDQLRDELLAKIDSPAALSISLEGVDHLDPAVLQVLVAAGRARQLSGHTLHLHDASSSLMRWFELAGADFLLQPTAPHTQEA